MDEKFFIFLWNDDYADSWSVTSEDEIVSSIKEHALERPDITPYSDGIVIKGCMMNVLPADIFNKEQKLLEYKFLSENVIFLKKRFHDEKK